MRFEEAYEGWNTGRLTQAEAARVLEMCECGFRRYLSKSIGAQRPALRGRADARNKARCAVVTWCAALEETD